MTRMRLPVGMQFMTALSNLLLSPRSFLNQMQSASAPLASEDLTDLDVMRAWWDDAQPDALSGDAPTLLLVSLLPIPYSIKVEALLARAMQKRGYKVVVLTNIASYSLVRAYHGDIGGHEIYVLENHLNMRNASTSGDILKHLLDSQEGLMQAIKAFRYRGAYTGLHALATLSSSVSDGKILLDKQNHRRLKRMLKRSMHLLDAASDIISTLSPSLILSVEKGFVGTAEIFYAALNAGVDYVQWASCHEPESIMLKRYSWHNFREHPFSISDAGWQRILELPWNDRYREGVMDQFIHGYQEGAWFRYKSLVTNQKQVAKQELVAQVGLDPAKKTAVIYSHILNDANLFYGQDLFSGGYEEWLVETVRAAAENSHVNWVLKLHPSNVYRNAKLGYSGEYGEILALKHAFGKVPEFLRVVYPEEKTSPFSFFQITDFGITVRGTVGLELPCFGVPVLTAGTGRYAGKGFTIDSATVEDYLAKIRTIHEIPALTEEQIRRGQRYAYFVFRARPARYGDMFSDVYNFPLSHPRYRDIALGGKPLDELLNHAQMQKITNFLCSDEEDFLDLSAA
jgi:hypothetical protein